MVVTRIVHQDPLKYTVSDLLREEVEHIYAINISLMHHIMLAHSSRK